MAPLTTPPRGSEKYERIIMDIIPSIFRDWCALRTTPIERMLMSIGFGQYSANIGSQSEPIFAQDRGERKEERRPDHTLRL